ncbi:hypothetical protein MKC64_07015 [[Clostridium] innocuum]|nr:hypothetical protein [[Clostridium] innocuum]
MSEVRCVCDLCAIGIQQDKMCYIGVQQCFKNGVYTKYKSRTNNSPLKFEDLHEGMWIWDDKNKIYNLIYKKRINCAKEKEIEFQWEMPDRECQNFMTDVYEENRFYRREVQQ